jgi:hypothetical protein
MSARRSHRSLPIERIRKDLIIPSGRRKGHNPFFAGVYRALAEHEKAQRYPDAVEQAHAQYGGLQQRAPASLTRRSTLSANDRDGQPFRLGVQRHVTAGQGRVRWILLRCYLDPQSDRADHEHVHACAPGHRRELTKA